MASALVIYGSTTGNTEMVAEKISDVLTDNGLEVTLKNVADAHVSELGGDYELTLLGSSTWGDSEIEFQEDFAGFFEQLDGARQLAGRKVALFGCGDSTYPHYCGAVDLLEESMENLGAKIVAESLRIDGDPSDAKQEILAWAEHLASNV